LFEVLYAAAETKGIATMQHWVRGSAVARLEPTVKPTDEPTGRGSIFREWLERLAASVTDTRRLPDAAVVLNGRGASGPDVVALFSPSADAAKARGSGTRALPAAVFVQCRRHQTPETKQTWKESVLSVLDGFVQMGAPAFQLAKCREALGLSEQDKQIHDVFYAPECRSTFDNRDAVREVGAVDHATSHQQTLEAFKLRLAFDAGAAERGAEALGSATADASFVVVQCRPTSTTINGHAKGSYYDLQVERAVRDILKAHATAKSPHARCFYIRTHPGAARFAPIHIAKEDGGFLIAEPGLRNRATAAYANEGPTADETTTKH
jgi:hypothetical protein